MIKLLLILSLISFNLYSQEICEEDSISALARGLSYPNCITPSNVDNFQLNTPEALCVTCKNEFELVYNKKVEENIPDLQKDFLKAALNEYKKNLTNNLLSSAKLKHLLKTNGKFDKSIHACKMKSSSDLLQGCKSQAAKKLLENSPFFEDLSNELANDLAKFLSHEAGFNPRPTLLTRTENQCYIPEKDILSFNTLSMEEAFTKDLIESLQKIDPSKFSSVRDIFNSDEIVENYEGDLAGLLQSLYNHPLFAPHLKSPDGFISLIKKIPQPASLENLRATLYSSENADSFDSELAESCEKSFKALKENICSDEFEKGKLYNDYASNYSKLDLSQTLPNEQKLASTDELFQNNLKFLSACENKDSSDRKKLTEVNGLIGISLNPEEASRPFTTYSGEKYKNEIGNLTNTLCQMTDESCVPGTITCSAYKKYKDSKIPGTLQHKLAMSSNSEVNALLRSMIGDTSKIDPQTKEILVLNGIIPKEDGTIVSQPDIPERRPEVFAQQSQNSNTAVAQAAPRPTAGAQASSRSRRPENTSATSNQGSYSNSDSSAVADSLSDLTDIFQDSNEDLRGIQDEIRRRLTELPGNRPASKQEARRIADDTFRRRGRSITPHQREALADRMMNYNQAEGPSAFDNNSTASEANRASVSDTATQLEKWKNGQRDAALMGMAGAQQVLNGGRTPASVDADPKELTKVALNIHEDPRVTLSDIFNTKLNQNDSETQLLKVLLRNKNNFLLQIRGVNFKILFNGQNSFNLLFDSGNAEEAERIRPQLEMFLQRLKT